MIRVLAATLLFALFQAPFPSFAGSHQWRFSEFYSSPDRTIQFIEMQEIAGSATEHAIQEHWYKTNSYNATLADLLGSPLPNVSTANKKFLVGSQSYAALTGVPPPDYVIPDGAINPAGDTVVWWFYQTIEIPVGVMPSDGANSISVVNPAIPGIPPVYSVGPNSPTNFAGQTGTVVLAAPVEPSPVPAASPRWLAVLAFAVAALGLLVLARRQTA